MKFFAVFVTLALAAASITHAAECTVDTLAGLESKSEFKKVTAECSAAQSITAGTPSEEAAKKLCKESDCINAINAMTKVLPDCTVQGENFKDTFEMGYKGVLDACKQLGTPVASSAPSAVLSAAATAVVAAAVVVVQL